jgi:hypothetical protein
MSERWSEWRRESQAVERVRRAAPIFDKFKRIPKPEFHAREARVAAALAAADFDGGLVYSEEHYAGDVPYRGSNTNVLTSMLPG